MARPTGFTHSRLFATARDLSTAANTQTLGTGSFLRRFIRRRSMRNAVLTLATSITWCIVVAQQPAASSLYRPELKRDMIQAERWKLDFELTNELGMGYHNNNRFDGVNAMGRQGSRAKWVESIAQWYEIADILQQLYDFRWGKTRSNEAVFNQLFDMGAQGDVSARCIAHFIYRSFPREDTAKWKHSLEEVERLALEVKDQGHPACIGMEGILYFKGELGYPQDRSLAKPFVISQAEAGYFAAQLYLAGTHLKKTEANVIPETNRELCWLRVAYQQAKAVSGFESACWGASQGHMYTEDKKIIMAPGTLSDKVREVGRKWCKPSQEEWTVTARDCAALENSNQSIQETK